MAVSANTFTVLTFLPFTDAAWTGLVGMGPPNLPGFLVDAILGGTDVFCFVTVASTNVSILTVDGTATFPATVIDADATQPSEMITSSLGTRSDLARSLDGSLLYWRTGFQMWTYDATDTGKINSITT